MAVRGGGVVSLVVPTRASRSIPDAAAVRDFPRLSPHGVAPAGSETSDWASPLGRAQTPRRSVAFVERAEAPNASSDRQCADLRPGLDGLRRSAIRRATAVAQADGRRASVLPQRSLAGRRCHAPRRLQRLPSFLQRLPSFLPTVSPREYCAPGQGCGAGSRCGECLTTTRQPRDGTDRTCRGSRH